MTVKITLAEYLFYRLHDAGLLAVHGVPGDYNLQLLDHVTPCGLEWVGNCNELNAGYATDGYARIKGIGALVTTFGVGELSAINAIAGAYAEMAPVVHIVGTPDRKSQSLGARLHHSFCRGISQDYEIFAEMYAKVTVKQENLINLSTAPMQIDRAIRECILQSRPVYIRVPMDMVHAMVPRPHSSRSMLVPGSHRCESLNLLPAPNEPLCELEIMEQIVHQIRNAKRPFILVDGGTSRYGLSEMANQLVKMTGFPTGTTPFGKGIVDETLRNFHGIYSPVGDKRYQSYLECCDLIINIGPVHSNVNTFYFTTVPKVDVSIMFEQDCVTVGPSTWNLKPKSLLEKILDNLAKDGLSRLEPYPDLPRVTLTPEMVEVHPSAELTQNIFWTRISSFFRSGDIIMTETGTASVGGRDMILPKGTTLINSSVWLSIGYMLAAAQGAALAQRNLKSSSLTPSQGRTILFEGDGSFQMTAQEVSTIIRKKLDVIIFIINNNGYTIERLIHGPEQHYNEVASWKYLEAPSFFGGVQDSEYPIFTASANTWGTLDAILNDKEFKDGRGLRIVELKMDIMDCTQHMSDLFQMGGKKD
ncbi:uncharacterized protein N7443_007205 [Penicillium atrosanguineum]|uniref:Pyruvate decarboxylase n=1 Tax=Penicillium atrosanguineum TaxID=1132637 RepID=A0A9W9PL57_9EURO|nr:uncharacterized protein N7443_007205 [Penicillium atrosanguineum]KAJ5296312.1 hypothetical protein N7443_007205 [Penicillium atrosanguineum]KAJ5299081.1 hypothetical protein N7476_010638 [Penicillium atrosanguineum]